MRKETANSDTGAPTPEVQSAPPPVSSDFSFTLQAVMELQKATGQLTEAISGLKVTVEKLDTKIDCQAITISGITHKIYATGVVLIIVLCVGGFIVNKAWDMMAAQIIEPPAIQADQNSHKNP